MLQPERKPPAKLETSPCAPSSRKGLIHAFNTIRTDEILLEEECELYHLNIAHTNAAVPAKNSL